MHARGRRGLPTRSVSALIALHDWKDVGRHPETNVEVGAHACLGLGSHYTGTHGMVEPNLGYGQIWLVTKLVQ